VIDQVSFLELRGKTIRQQFEEFHEANPHVYELLAHFSRQLKATGRSRGGIRMVWERMRWELTIQTNRSPDGFKLNDHLTSRYARLLMEQEPDLAGFFETRHLRAP
jgi:hypothetical protein